MCDDGSAGLCVLLGAPRSGTTWLQRLLACSSAVSSPQETHLFREYLGPQMRQWEAHERRITAALERLDDGHPADRVFGLPTILSRERLLDSQRALVRSVVDLLTDGSPDVRWVVEKTPSNSLCVDLIDEVCPDAHYVHIVRDPRDVVRSLRAAGRTWGRWAPTDAASGARMWRSHVLGARRAQELAPDRYVELHYEDLRRDPVAELGPVLRLLGLDDDAADLVRREEEVQDSALTDVFAFRPDLEARIAELGGGEPSGFRSRNGARPDLSSAERRRVWAVAADVAVEMGYGSGWPEPVGRAIGAAWTAAAGVEYRVAAVRRRLRRERAERRRARPIGTLPAASALESTMSVPDRED